MLKNPGYRRIECNEILTNPRVTDQRRIIFLNMGWPQTIVALAPKLASEDRAQLGGEPTKWRRLSPSGSVDLEEISTMRPAFGETGTEQAAGKRAAEESGRLERADKCDCARPSPMEEREEKIRDIETVTARMDVGVDVVWTWGCNQI